MDLKYCPKNSKNKPNFLALKITSAVIITLSFVAILLSFSKNNGTNSTRAMSKKAKIVSVKQKNGKKNKKHHKKAKVLAKFKSRFPTGASEKNRIFNIKKISKTLNNKIVKPGAEFSFKKIYNSSKKKGKFKKALGISNQKLAIVYAGGICQVSTALYKAVAKLNLPVTERHNHSIDVFYSAKGSDAMFNSKSADFKFKNSKKFPIKIKTKVGKNYVLIKIIKAKKKKI